MIEWINVLLYYDIIYITQKLIENILKKKKIKYTKMQKVRQKHEFEKFKNTKIR